MKVSYIVKYICENDVRIQMIHSYGNGQSFDIAVMWCSSYSVASKLCDEMNTANRLA